MRVITFCDEAQNYKGGPNSPKEALKLQWARQGHCPYWRFVQVNVKMKNITAMNCTDARFCQQLSG